MTIDVPVVTGLLRLYQPCTNSVPKPVKRQPNQQKSPLVYQSSHVYSSPPNTQSRIKCTYQVKTSVTVCID